MTQKAPALRLEAFPEGKFDAGSGLGTATTAKKAPTATRKGAAEALGATALALRHS